MKGIEFLTILLRVLALFMLIALSNESMNIYYLAVQIFTENYGPGYLDYSTLTIMSIKIFLYFSLCVLLFIFPENIARKLYTTNTQDRFKPINISAHELQKIGFVLIGISLFLMNIQELISTIYTVLSEDFLDLVDFNNALIPVYLKLVIAILLMFTPSKIINRLFKV